MPKATNPEKARRIKKVVELYYILGLGAPAIRQYFKNNEDITVSLSTVEKYIAEAKRKTKTKIKELDLDEKVCEILEKYDYLIKLALKQSDARLTQSIMRDLVEFLGLKEHFSSSRKKGGSVFEINIVSGSNEKKSWDPTKK
ncbi:MAG: hypothetical protein GY757_10165 [bacterium]|nr:hypothetical protein [bacterium]